MESGNVTINNRTRKRAKRPELYAENIQKRKKAAGEEYISSAGVTVRAKQPQPVNCSKCRFKCNDKVSEQQRVSLCKSFYEMADYTRQKDFIVSHMQEMKSKVLVNNACGHHITSRCCYLPSENGRVRVCQKFFCSTLDVKERAMRKYLTSRNNQNVTIGALPDQRGRHQSKNKTPDWKNELIKQHISMYPCVESHYCRSSSNRQYLDSTLSIQKMYDQFREFWKTKQSYHNLETSDPEENSPATDEDIPSVTVYRKVFCTEFNLSFYKPKKDQCNECETFKNRTADEKEQQKEAHEKHIEQKQVAQDEKKKDREKMANSSGTTITATFDLQSVLQLPSGSASLLYYKRKLVVHNCTIYEDLKRAFCFVWLETDGRCGSSEIGTTLYRYLSGLPVTVKEVILYSDSCTGQNRNQFITAVLLHAVQVLHIDIIEQKFLVPGHTQMECDSMHAAIEHAQRYQKMYVPNDWLNVMTSARRKQPYQTEQLFFGDFYDLKALATDLLPNRKTNSSRNSVNWMEIRCIRVSKASPGTVFYKTDFRQPEYSQIEQGPRPSPVLQPLYDRQLSISKLKKQDLLSLCSSCVIPSLYHNFYRDLPTSDLPGIRDAAMSEDNCDSGKAVDETSVILNLSTECNETQNQDVMQLYPSSSAPLSKQAPKDRRQTQKRGRDDATAITSHTGHEQNHTTNELAALDIMSSSTSNDTNHRTTRSSARIHARSKVDNAVSITSQTHPMHRPVTKPTSMGPLPKKRLLH